MKHPMQCLFITWCIISTFSFIDVQGAITNSETLWKELIEFTENLAIDSIKNENYSFGQLQKNNPLIFLNKEFSTEIFNSCTTLHTIRIFHGGATRWRTSVSIAQFDDDQLEKIVKLFKEKKQNTFSFKMYNHYYWYESDNYFVLIESYGIKDTVCSKICEQIEMEIGNIKD